MLYVLPPSPWAPGLCAAAPRPPRRRRIPTVTLDSGTGAGGSQEDDDASRSSSSSRSLSECYFAGKGAALVLPPTERVRICNRRVSSDIQQHLQSMFYLLRAHDTLKMAVKLESAHPGRTRYLVVVSSAGRQDSEESALLGIDCNARTTVGLVLRVLADTTITLDGDGGFSVSVCGQHHIFKPVSVQAMWSALQTLHRVSSKAREHNHFLAGLTHDWVSYYEQRVESERSCLNEWHAMDSLESRRPPSPDSLRTKPRERAETEQVIRSTLKEIMMSVDLDEVTSKYIRSRLEEDLDMDLGEFKSFIDQEMLTILGQMDAATEIFDHVYLGSEWNASNLEELQKNGVRHILNVTREIDNFFPGMFNYQNIRVYDDEKTDLLKHWDNTFRYITSAKKEGSKVLVHCKMGVSRSASVVIAYAMKAYDWDYKKAFDYVKQKRNCIKPNTSFVNQLETYQGMLDAMKHRERLQRSKSETNLKSPSLVAKAAPRPALLGVGAASGRDLARDGARPKSWSPDNADAAFPPPPPGASVSLERLEADSRNYRMPCGNGQAYSVSQNKALHLDTAVRKRVGELEARASSRRGLVLNLTSQFEAPKAVPVKKETWDPGEGDGAVFISELRLTDDSRQQGNGVVTTSTNAPPPRDPFSAQLDRVFDREERRQLRPGSETSPPEPAPAPPPSRDCPSRQSSWSSYDSAVVLGFQGDAPSRQSSWGSADARRAPPSRNSSWGSYDLRPPGAAPSVVGDEAPAKRAKQKAEEGAAAVKRVCQGDAASATSNAGVVIAAQCTSVKQHKRVLENLTNLPNAAPTGLVRSLKKEFEAKAEGGAGGGGGSLPSSPVGTHPAPPPEDLSVRVLVGRYEGGKAESAPVSKKLPLTRHAAPAVYNTM